MSVTLLEIASTSLFLDGIEPFFGRSPCGTLLNVILRFLI